jgi:WS/DGAT/MGAT family acyltransferase
MASAYERLSTQDSSFILFEQRATHMHVAALAIFEGGPLRNAAGGIDAARIARYVESRLAVLPHYRQKLAFAPISGHPVWVDDDHFDLDYHVRHTALPAPGTEEELKRLVGRILSQPLDRDRPLWETWIIEGLEGGRFALLTKVHHCMVDGAAGVSILTLLLRSDPSEEIPPAEAWFPRLRPGPLRLYACGPEAMLHARRPTSCGASSRSPCASPRRRSAPRGSAPPPSPRRSGRASTCPRTHLPIARSGRTGAPSGASSTSPSSRRSASGSAAR